MTELMGDILSCTVKKYFLVLILLNISLKRFFRFFLFRFWLFKLKFRFEF